MAFTLALNSSNVISGSNNTSFKYNFIGGGFAAKDMQICVGALTMPYSIFNISSFYGNNTFQIIFPTLTGPLFAPVTLPDGHYSVVDIQQYIQAVCITNGFYLIDSTGDYVFYLYLTYSPVYYALQLVATLVPTVLPAGWSVPSNWNGFPPISYTANLYLDNTNSIAPIIGFNPTQYYFPPNYNYTSNYSTLSTLTPQGSTVNSIIIKNTLCSNQCTTPSDIMDGFSIGQTAFGSNIIYEPAFQKNVPIRDGTYNSMVISFVDQNLNSFVANDPNVAITILISKRND